MRRAPLLFLSGLLALPLLTGAQQSAGETLPTPYTAEQIRDAWSEGLEVRATVTVNGVEQISVTTVEAWSPETVTTCEQTLSQDGKPQGEKACGEATWDELRRHATFPADKARRERVRQTTPLGENLEGWLYLVEGADGSVSEFFFADATPGSPATLRQTRDGEVVFEMVQTKRATQGP